MPEQKRARGRPALDDPLSASVRIRMRPDQSEKLKRLGGPGWIRNKIDQADDPATQPRETKR